MLRVLAEKKSGYWLATCLELNICAMGNTPEEAHSSIKEAIIGYLKAVIDTDDKISIPTLLNRPAPLKKRMMFWLIKKTHDFRKLKAMQLNQNSINKLAHI